MPALFGRFSRNSQQVLEKAHEIAVQLGRPVQTDTLILSIANNGNGPAADILKSMGLDQRRLMEAIITMPVPAGAGEGHLTSEMTSLLEESIKLASKFRFATVEVEHLLYAIAKNEAFVGHQLLKLLDVDTKVIALRLGEWMQSISMISQGAENRFGDPEERRGGEQGLERFTVDLTEAAEKGELDPVVGRDKEIEQMIQILLRRRKNNPLLIGEPGVGKTALVDGLAQRIVRFAVPQALADKRVLLLDLSLVVAGTMYRGQFEERLKGIISEVQSDGDTILFIDEVHTISNTGGSEGGFDAANILKPALARGDVTLIGATTHEEYRKHILKDKALDRRFQTIQVEEPGRKEALLMLKGLKKDLESHHKVMITDEAMKAAVDLSTRYIHDKFLPDKAIDVLDQAATFHAEPYSGNDEIEELQIQIADVAAKRLEVTQSAETDDEYNYARILSHQEEELTHELQRARKDKQRLRVTKPVTDFHVSRVIAERTGIPLAQIRGSLEPLDLARLQGVLDEHVLGQTHATKEVTGALLRAQLGLTPVGKPMGSFLLVGPTGVGKTETARILAREVFGDDKALIKIDMSEYMERHTVSNLIGAPAGYVGYEQGGGLTEQVRRRPYAVVLFDEVEKAHPDVFNVLLQVLEDGYLTDNSGLRVSFEHTVIVMTSNIGMPKLNQMARIGFEGEKDETIRNAEIERQVRREISDFFRPELLGRLSGIVFYAPLDKAVIKKLIARHVQELKRRLKERNIALKQTAAFTQWLLGQYQPEAGARSIDRIFLTQVEPPLIAALIEQSGRSSFQLDMKEGKVIATAVAEALVAG